MEYEGLTDDDLANVRALNRAWLDEAGKATRPLGELSPHRLERIAEAPFLLFSLREHDLALWDRLLDGAGQHELFRESAAASDRLRHLQATALAFLWALARRNPYVARLVSGAPLSWCERVASATLAQLTTAAARRALLEARFARDAPEYRRLIMHGGSTLRDVREFAQLVTLQMLLTGTGAARYGRFPAAACRMPDVARRIADKL